MNSILFYLISCLLFFTTFVFGSNLEVEFFNVGQGHCTLVSFKEGPPLLIDAGSSGIPGDNPQEKTVFKAKQLAVIASAVKDKGNTTDKTKWNIDLNVIISHGDEDHYNWVVDLFDKYTTTLRIRFLLGGKKEDYSKNIQELVKKYEKAGMPSYISECNGDLAAIPKFVCHEATCHILAANSTQDKNQGSIVIKVSDNSPGGKSVILTGDATGKTTEQILKEYAEKLSELKATILQASHHGADSDGSNNKAWFVATSPTYVVISAGTRHDYMHPKQQALENALYSPSLKRDVQVHTLQYNSERPFYDYHKMLGDPKTVFRLSSDYLMALTTVGIFNTTNQGNIVFKQDKISYENTPKNRNVPIDSAKGLFFFLLNKSFFAKQIVALNLPAMQLSKEEFGIMQSALAQSSSCLSCDFSGVTLETDNSWQEQFKAFFEAMSKLRECVFFKGVTQEDIDYVKGLWGHRGFSYQNTTAN